MIKKKRVIFIILCCIAAAIILGVICYEAQKSPPASEDPLYGSFSIKNGAITAEIYPADFLVSIDVATSHATLQACAEKCGVDLSTGCWVYCFAEDKIFRAVKEGHRLHVYEGRQEIGRFTYACKKILSYAYDESYTVNWRGAEFHLEKTLQGFLFP